MYQRMKATLTTEPPDQEMLQFVCNKVPTTGLRCLNVPAVLSLETHSILTDVMLTPSTHGWSWYGKPYLETLSGLVYWISEWFGTPCPCRPGNLQLHDERGYRL